MSLQQKVKPSAYCQKSNMSNKIKQNIFSLLIQGGRKLVISYNLIRILQPITCIYVSHVFACMSRLRALQEILVGLLLKHSVPVFYKLNGVPQVHSV